MASGSSPSTGEGADTVLVVVLGAGVAVLGSVWAGAELAAHLHAGHWVPTTLRQTAAAVGHLPDHARSPRLAWPGPMGSALGGPVLYWACTAVAALVAVTAAWLVSRLFRHPAPGTERTERLGVDTRSRLASARDLAPLVVRGSKPGRLTLGRVQGRLVATERRPDAEQRRHSRRRSRHGDRSAVAVIGPTRCGKTANTISGILEWEGPAILSSVKDDLLRATLARREQLGEVRIFDPTGSSGEDSASWSPLGNAGTATGAQKAARAISAGRPQATQSNESVEFFSGLAEQLLWPMFYAARTAELGMASVVRWVLSRDHSTPTHKGEITAVLDKALTSADEGVRASARAAALSLQSIWELDHRTRSSVYATAQHLIGAWGDPAVAATAACSDIDLDWLVSGPNTLYICAPLHEQARLATVFGGLLGDLMQQAYERASATGKPLPDTLVVLDEAANTPTRWLPGVASTCSGIGILLVTIWQSKAQLDAAYGPLADSVLTNHGTKIFFSGVSDQATLEYASRLVGDEEVLARSVTIDGGGRRSVHESASRVRLVPSDLLRQVVPFEALLVHGTLRPAHLVARPYHRDRRLRALSRQPRPIPKEGQSRP